MTDYGILVSCTSIDEYLWKIERYLMKKYGCDTAIRDIDPLRWYICTGRASASWCKCLMAKIPYHVAKILHQGGSYCEVLDRVDAYIGW